MGVREYCQSHLPAARDPTTSTISGRRRAPWHQRLRPSSTYQATRHAQMVVRNRAVIIRKAELTGDAGGGLSKRILQTSIFEREGEGEGKRAKKEEPCVSHDWL